MLPTLHSLKGSCTQVKQLAQMPFEPLFPTSCFHCNISFRNRFRSCVPHHRNLHVKSGQMAMPCSNQIPFQSETFTKRLWNWFDLTFISIAYIGPRSVLEMNIYCDETSSHISAYCIWVYGIQSYPGTILTPNLRGFARQSLPGCTSSTWRCRCSSFCMSSRNKACIQSD